MNRKSANLLLAGKAEIRSIGEPCDPSCALWFCCANSTPNGVCKGFLLLDGRSKELLRQNILEDDLIYLGNCARMIQNGTTPKNEQALTKEVYRYLKPINEILRAEQKGMPLGFRGMLNAIIERSSEPEFHAKLLTQQQTPAFGFFKYKDKPEYPQKTNQEIQEEIEKEESRNE
jgi:hypothetical protein